MGHHGGQRIIKGNTNSKKNASFKLYFSTCCREFAKTIKKTQAKEPNSKLSQIIST